MNLWLTLAAVEVGLIVFGLLLSVWIGQMLAKRRDRKAVRSLVDRVTAQKDQRAEAIRVFLTNNFALSDEEFQARASAIQREELRLYQRFANLYLRRDAGSVANFQVPFEAGVEPYWQLKGGDLRVVPAQPEPSKPEVELVTATDDAELSRLRADVERLERRSAQLGEHLGLAVENLARMLDEYSSLFDGASVDELSGAPLIAEAREVIAETGLNATDEVGRRRSETGHDEQEFVEPTPTADRELASEDLAQAALTTENENDANRDQESAVEESQPAIQAEPRSGPAGARADDETPTASPGLGAVPTETDEPDGEVVTVEPRAPRSMSGAALQASPAADELLASLDANLPVPPEEAEDKPPVLASEADLDALFDAEPELDAPAAQGDGTKTGNGGSFDTDERDEESVAIVHKDKTDNVLI